MADGLGETRGPVTELIAQEKLFDALNGDHAVNRRLVGPRAKARARQ